MKMFKIFLIMVVGSILTGCYNDFETPKPSYVYNDQIMKGMGMTHISIYDLKKLFGEISGTGSTNVSDGLSATMYKRFVTNKSQATDWEQSTGRYIVGNYYIKGKVISNDKEGNVYKSLYIYDGTAAIELKLTNGLYLDYPFNMDTLESQWVYVRLNGLYMGNFRMMLSIGDIPTEGMNSYGRPKFYPNSNIVSPEKVAKHVFKGEKVTLTKGRLANDGSNKNAYDILEIDEENCSQILYKNSDNGINYFGRLMQFNDLEVAYKGVKNQDGETPAKFADDADDTTGYYPAWICTSGTMKDADGTPLVEEFIDGPWGKMAYSENNVSLYGQMVVSYDRDANAKNKAGVYVVRTSGYSKYAGKYVPMDGARGTITAIYTIYSKQVKSSSSSSYETYQLNPCRFEDILPEYYGAADYGEKEAIMAKWAKPVSEGGVIPDSSFARPQTINEEDDGSNSSN